MVFFHQRGQITRAQGYMGGVEVGIQGNGTRLSVDGYSYVFSVSVQCKIPPLRISFCPHFSLPSQHVFANSWTKDHASA